MTSTIDTSIYGNIQNPLTQVAKLQEMQAAQQGIQIRGAQLGANQSVGNALMHNTGPDGTVNTDGMMAELAGSGNPYAQQQGAELAQHLQLQQSINAQQQLAASQARDAYISNETAAMAQAPKSEWPGIIATQYGKILQNDSESNPHGFTTAGLMKFAYGDPEQGQPGIMTMPEDQARQHLMNVSRITGIRSGVGSAALSTVPNIPVYQNGGTTVISPQAAVLSGGSATTNPPAPTTSSAGTMPPPGNPDATKAGDTLPPISSMPDMGGNYGASVLANAATPAAQKPNMIPGSLPTGPNATQASAIKQMQDSTANLNSDAEMAQKQIYALQSASQLIDKDPSATGPIRAAMLQLVHTNPALAVGINDPDKLADAQDIQKFLDNAFPRSARSDSDQALLSAASPNNSMLYPAVKRAIQFQMANAQLPIEKQRLIGPVLNNGGNAADLTTKWATYANPRVAEYASLPPAARASFRNSLPQAEQEDLANRLQNLSAIGAFPQLNSGKANGN